LAPAARPQALLPLLRAGSAPITPPVHRPLVVWGRFLAISEISEALVEVVLMVL
jgi:hypothetical protein